MALIEPEERKKQIANKGKYFKQLHITTADKQSCTELPRSHHSCPCDSNESSETRGPSTRCSGGPKVKPLDVHARPRGRVVISDDDISDGSVMHGWSNLNWIVPRTLHQFVGDAVGIRSSIRSAADWAAETA